MAGRYLIPQAADDSNTSMQYCPERQMLTGSPLAGGFRLGLFLTRLEIMLLDAEYTPVATILLEGKDRRQAFKAIKQMLETSGIAASELKDKMHYEIPYHRIQDGYPFTIFDQKYFDENTITRHDSGILLQSIVSRFPDAAPVRVWPHHFDTGTIIPVEYSDSGEVSTYLGLGYAIPDALIAEPYFYLNFRSGDQGRKVEKLPGLPAGNWMLPRWNGAVLRLSEILNFMSAEKQEDFVKSFFDSGIEILLKHIVNPD